eukprot:gene15420-biopygen12726
MGLHTRVPKVPRTQHPSLTRSGARSDRRPFPACRGVGLRLALCGWPFRTALGPDTFRGMWTAVGIRFREGATVRIRSKPPGCRTRLAESLPSSTSRAGVACRVPAQFPCPVAPCLSLPIHGVYGAETHVTSSVGYRALQIGPPQPLNHTDAGSDGALEPSSRNTVEHRHKV